MREERKSRLKEDEDAGGEGRERGVNRQSRSAVLVCGLWRNPGWAKATGLSGWTVCLLIRRRDEEEEEEGEEDDDDDDDENGEGDGALTRLDGGAQW